MPILDAMLSEQKATGNVWTPSSFIRRLGKEINNEESVYYWAYKVNRCFSRLPGMSEIHLLRMTFLFSAQH